MNIRDTATAEGPAPPGSKRRTKGSGRGFLGVFVAALLISAPSLWSEPETALAWIKIYVQEPGVHAVPFTELLDAAGEHGEQLSGPLRLTHRGQPVAAWRESDATNGAIHDARLIFVVTRGHLLPRDRHGYPGLAVLKLEFGGPGLPHLGESPHAAMPEGLPTRRLLYVEEDQLRVPWTADDLETLGEDVPLWQWSLLSQYASSYFEVDLGALADLSPVAHLDVHIRLLGWSEPDVPPGTAHHVVDVLWNGQPIGSGQWDGRRSHVLTLRDVAPSVVDPESNRLRLKIPQRQVDGAQSEIIDVVYVDAVQVSYERSPGPAQSQIAFTAPLGGSESGPWSLGVGDKRMFPSGLPAPQGPRTPQDLDMATAFQADPMSYLQPLHIAPASHPWRALGNPLSEADYVIVVPPSLAEPAKAFAAHHRRAGLATALVNAHWLFDEFGDGLRHPQAIRDFLLNLHAEHGRLRYVLLVGDADWRTPDEVPFERRGDHRNLIPTWVYLSKQGPAASDHGFAVADPSEQVPRFAIGRLPVASELELLQVVEKNLRYAETPPRSPLWALTFGSGDRVSQGRLRRFREHWQKEPVPGVHISSIVRSPDRPLDVQVLQHWGKAPDLVYFNGHGSRHLWRLGEANEFQPTFFLDEEEAVSLPATPRPPAVVSISCATAPFDHPDTSSIGEHMVLNPDGSAIAFFGASARLFTPPRFGQQLMRSLSQGETFGDALVQAKVVGRKDRLSHLYHLLGDPASRIRTTPDSTP